MLETLGQSELFAGLPEPAWRELEGLGRRRAVAAGETLFRIGDDAREFHVIRRGRLELTFPLAVMGETKETRFQSLEAGRTVAWSALVPPHRLTMSARASTDAELLSFERVPVLEHLARRPDVGFVVMGNLSRVVAARLHEVLALWLREVQRNVSHTYR
ncbi:MAG TPA: cyclic nucleotide-binding domain-containing protein [Anaeromyxobacter sp.]|nr:cyclic nucleotide-binding domain-containing protein [Anaeromyxobacter sp.]